MVAFASCEKETSLLGPANPIAKQIQAEQDSEDRDNGGFKDGGRGKGDIIISPEAPETYTFNPTGGSGSGSVSEGTVGYPIWACSDMSLYSFFILNVYDDSNVSVNRPLTLNFNPNDFSEEGNYRILGIHWNVAPAVAPGIYDNANSVNFVGSVGRFDNFLTPLGTCSITITATILNLSEENTFETEIKFQYDYVNGTIIDDKVTIDGYTQGVAITDSGASSSSDCEVPISVIETGKTPLLHYPGPGEGAVLIEFQPEPVLYPPDFGSL